MITELVVIKDISHLVVDMRPKMGEWYIDTHNTNSALSVQKHYHVRYIKNHKRDWRWVYCKKMVASNDPIYKLPTCNDYLG